MNTKAKEIIARAIEMETRWPTINPKAEMSEEICDAIAQAAIQALSDAGMGIVPREASDAMIEAAFKAEQETHPHDKPAHMQDVWQAMITAAQEE